MLCDAAAARAARHREQDARPTAVVTLLTCFYWVLTRALVVQALAGGCGEGLRQSYYSAAPASTYLYPPHPSLSLSLSLSLTRTLALPEAVGGGPGVRALCCQSPRHQYTHP